MSSNFNHPFQPYGIQIEFMKALYDCIQDGKVGIFESPTGEFCGLSRRPTNAMSLTQRRDWKIAKLDLWLSDMAS